MEQIPSTEANIFSSSQEISHIWKQEIRYRVRNTPPLVPIHTQINLDHNPIFMIHFNIILSYYSKFPK